jgi:hypothetical protein
VGYLMYKPDCPSFVFPSFKKGGERQHRKVFTYDVVDAGSSDSSFQYRLNPSSESPYPEIFVTVGRIYFLSIGLSFSTSGTNTVEGPRTPS